MRGYFLGALLALFVASPASAIGSRTALADVQQECAAIGDVAFGDGQRWANCSVSRGRWVATIELVDMYQAQYCLGNAPDGRCEQRAMSLFGNRAYTPVADLLFQRIDPGEVAYDDPLVVKNDYGRILTVSARLPGDVRSNNYFLWQSQHGKHEAQWLPIDARAWLKDLARKLPAGVTPVDGAWPDVDTMSASVQLLRTDQRSTSAGVAQVELGLAGKRFVLKKVTLGETAR